MSEDAAKIKDAEILEGRTITDMETLEAIYQMGAFRYQVSRKNHISRIGTCDSPRALQSLRERLNAGMKVVVEVPKR